jgi:Uma2 family endonuclease
MKTADLVEKLSKELNAWQVWEGLGQKLEQERRKREEFYNLIHENVKAEFINGEIVMHSPVRNRHWTASMKISSELHRYVKDNALGVVSAEKVMIRLTRNDYEPDIVFFSTEKIQSFTPDQLLFPAPDLVGEILSESTERTDRTIKFSDYEAHGVSEYWIVDPEQRSIEQYLLENGEYNLHVKLAGEGLLHARSVAGFTIRTEDIFG